MNTTKQFLQVNWVDGMKINKSHFIAQENSFTDQLNTRFSTTINPYNYGLIPSFSSNSAPLKIVINADSQHQLVLKLFECRAITPGGIRIDIQEKSFNAEDNHIPFPELVYDIGASQSGHFYIALSINPFVRVPVGHCDPDENPPRFPFTIPELKLHMIPVDQLLDNHPGEKFILIGKLVIKDGQATLDNEYLPPCHTISCHPKLITLHADFESMLIQLESNILKILRKINEKEKSNGLTDQIGKLAYHLLNNLGEQILNFKWCLTEQAPIFMFESMARLARIMRNYMESLASTTKEELFNYLTEWCSLNQSEFEQTLLACINFNYKHHQINDTSKVITHFSNTIGELFSKLSTLEYIGKKKDTSVFVKEQPSKRSFLAD